MAQDVTAADREIVVVASREAFYAEAAESIARSLARAVAERGAASLALAGGSTPAAVYRLLAADVYARRIPWERVHLFWGDERLVPRGDPRSNFSMVAESLLSRLPLPVENIHAVPHTVPYDDAGAASRAAAEYEAHLRACPILGAGPWPRFDLILLGLGEDGHTASLFPGSAALAEQRAWVVPGLAPAPPAERVTLTLPALNHSAFVLFLVAGKGKAAIVRRVFEAKDLPPLPATQVIPRDGKLVWLMDAEAANR